MAVRPILRWPDARLAQACDPVGDEELRGLVADLFETMYAAQGRGLAAPQIGVMKRVFVMDATWKEGTRTPEVFIDPAVLVASNEKCVIGEGCLSIPGLTVPVERPVAVTLGWRCEKGDLHMRDFDGAEARVIQHELDHLEGRVSLDRVSAELRADLLEDYAA
jgi:peptide deformylase